MSQFLLEADEDQHSYRLQPFSYLQARSTMIFTSYLPSPYNASTLCSSLNGSNPLKSLVDSFHIAVQHLQKAGGGKQMSRVGCTTGNGLLLSALSRDQCSTTQQRMHSAADKTTERRKSTTLRWKPQQNDVKSLQK